jgi:P27 family predicted phage terminase small subunit
LQAPAFNPPPAVLRAPAFLQGEGRAEFRRLAKLLSAQHVLAATDLGLLAMLAQTWARWLDAHREPAALPVEERIHPGTNRPHALYAICNGLAATVHRLSREFGLSPLSRASVSPIDPGPQRTGGGWDQFSS